ncbi:MAG: hypothetical protein KDA63_17560 [Planctomycetales bacterium]|nr:hypothetical protein [Planctomycetales bacterium]
MMLVVLRVAIGWHFMYQGLWKLEEPDFSSEGFLRQAKGPFAERFYAMVPDYQGRDRLDREKQLARLSGIRGAAIEKYGLDEAQQAELAARYDQRVWELESLLGTEKSPGALSEDLDKHMHEWDRLAKAENDPAAGDVPYKQQRNWEKRKKLEGEAKPWLEEIAAIESELVADVDAVLNDQQRARGEILPEPSPLAGFDRFLIGSLIAIGVCLTAGLLTRLAALGGAAFLLGVVLSQPPWPSIYPPPPPAVGPALIVNKEVIEMIALLVLAALPVGRWGGLDFFIHHLLFGRRSPQATGHQPGEKS